MQAGGTYTSAEWPSMMRRVDCSFTSNCTSCARMCRNSTQTQRYAYLALSNGDHHFAVGRVTNLDSMRNASAMAFYRGKVVAVTPVE